MALLDSRPTDWQSVHLGMEYKDYYKSLGVEKNASQDDIRRAFRKLARKYHPDVAEDKASAENKFKEINEAYEVLGDEEKRAKYDRLGANWQQAEGFAGAGGFPGGMGGFSSAGGRPGGEYEFHFGGTGFSDFFEAFFGGGGRTAEQPYGGMGFGGATVAARGRDVEADLALTLDEVFNGGSRTISLSKPGSSESPQKYTVKIPAGIREGQKIRLQGRGEAGADPAQPGDLYLRIRYQKHPFFAVDADDLLCDVPLAPWQAVLGHEVEMDTFDGRLRLKIPAGTQPGQKFRFRGKGMRRKDGDRGDLYAVADIEMPRSLNAEQRKLWQQLQDTA